MTSAYAVIMPLLIKNSQRYVTVRVSVVNQELPLLLSRGVLKSLGAIMNLADGQIDFHELWTTTKLINTEAGLCGFLIDDTEAYLPWEQLVEDDVEVLVSTGQPEIFRTQGLSQNQEPHT